MRAGATVPLNEKLGRGTEGGGARLDNYHDPHTLCRLDGPGDHDDEDEYGDDYEGDELDNDDDYGGGGPSTTTILTLFVGWTGLKKVIIIFIRVHIKDIFIFHLHPHYNDQVLWAVYGDCDPIAGHQIKKADQLLPLLVLQVSGGKDDR